MRRFAVAVLVVALLAVAGGVAGWYYRSNLPDFVQALIAELDPEAFQKGEFKGDLEVRFFSAETGDGKTVELILLLKPFGYIDSNGVEWNVPAGFISDGASIPEWLWVMLGGPFSGPYRDAAVIHDYYCSEKTRPWEDVHKVFLEAAVNRGTSEDLAKTLYAGVLLGGPRWDTPPRARFSPSNVMRAQAVPTAKTEALADETDKQEFEDLKAWIEREKPTLEEIQRRVKEIREKKQ